MSSSVCEQLLLPEGQRLATTRSGLPSPFTSAAATESVPGPPELKVTAGLKVPSPFPSSTPNELFPEQSSGAQQRLATARWCLPSPFRSSTAIDLAS